jgi:glucose 1-dehydrogenase
MQIDLTGKRALVTGANSGLGAAIASALGKAGARVAINYVVHPENARAVADTIESSQPLTLQADVSSPDAVATMFQQLDTTWGGLDILVNNAGIDGARAVAWEVDPSTWRKVMDINLFGAFLCCREALQRMTKQNAGVILNITSVHEVIAWSGYSAYTSAKAGLGMLTKTLAQEAAPFGVRVLALAPGAIKTPINESVWRDPKMLRDLENKIALGRMGVPEEIANLVVTLVSDVASYVTGTTLFADGGMTDYPDFAHGG